MEEGKMKKAVVACQVFYRELMDLAAGKDIDIEFLPQGLHDLSRCQDMREKIQRKIDELENKSNYDYIILGYGYCSGGVEGLRTEKAKLVIPVEHDCIPLLIGEPSQEKEGRIDGGKTYYLSRGWIDCGGDTYKNYLHMVDKMDDWVRRYEEYQQNSENVMFTWHETEQLKHGRHYPEEMARYISYECLKNYRSITLIDNGYLEPIQREYAREMYNFINELIEERRGTGLDFNVIKGKMDYLQKLITFPAADKIDSDGSSFIVTPPGNELQLERYIIGYS